MWPSVYAPEGLGEAEQAALAKIRFLTQEHGQPALDVVFSGFGEAEDFAHVSPLFGLSRRWRSKTPFVLPRPVKEHRHRPEEQLAHELSPRGFAAPVAVEPEIGAALFDPGAGQESRTRWLSFQMRRRRDRGNEAVTTTGFGGFSITFAEAQQGPILLGYGAHYGLGQFEAVSDDGWRVGRRSGRLASHAWASRGFSLDEVDRFPNTPC
jgi:CRISPR-associated protein Csb2